MSGVNFQPNVYNKRKTIHDKEIARHGINSCYFLSWLNGLNENIVFYIFIVKIKTIDRKKDRTVTFGNHGSVLGTIFPGGGTRWLLGDIILNFTLTESF